MGVDYPKHVIDVHAHCFNAHHLPVEGMLLGGLGVKDTDNASFRRWLARRLRDITVKLVASEARRTDQTDLPTLERFLSTWSEEEVLDLVMADVYDRIRIAISEDLAQLGVTREANLDRWTALIRDLVAADGLVATAYDIQMVYESALAASASSDEQLDRVVCTVATSDSDYRKLARNIGVSAGRGLVSGDNVITRAAWEWIVNQISFRLLPWLLDHSGNNIMVFVARMLSSERKNVEAVLSGYGANQNVNTIVQMHMDMELAYPRPKHDDDPYLSPDEQLSRMKALKDEFAGRLVWFAAFDPRRCIGGKNVEDYCNWLKSFGAHGFKFYPPMGYRPSSNTTELQKVVDAFFEFCCQSGAEMPVFAHCTPNGFQNQSGSGLNGEPKFWREALERFPKLRLCLGHAGGGRQTNNGVSSAGWYATLQEWKSPNWARDVVELCTDFENVYCELGHLEAVLDVESAHGNNLAINLRNAWHMSGAYQFKTKCMYGSDAVMPAVVRHTRQYLEAFQGIFSQHLTQPDFEAFVVGNARKYLDL